MYGWVGWLPWGASCWAGGHASLPGYLPPQFGSIGGGAAWPAAHPGIFYVGTPRPACVVCFYFLLRSNVLIEKCTAQINFHKVNIYACKQQIKKQNMASTPETNLCPLPVTIPKGNYTLASHTVVLPVFYLYIKTNIHPAFFCIWLLSFGILFEIHPYCFG